MFISLSGHKSSIVGWSAKTVRGLSDFRPVIVVTSVKKESFGLNRSNIISRSIHSLCTMPVAVTNVFTTTCNLISICFLVPYNNPSTCKTLMNSTWLCLKIIKVQIQSNVCKVIWYVPSTRSISDTVIKIAIRKNDPSWIMSVCYFNAMVLLLTRNTQLA